MQIRPGADTNRVDSRVLDHLTPISGYTLDTIHLGNRLGRRKGTIGHNAQFHVLELMKAWNVHLTGIGPCTDKTDSKFMRRHNDFKVASFQLVDVPKRLVERSLRSVSS